ncbi:MAG TPA: DUF262 domain-containing protein [Myxococcaceae bacterium]|jgi:hypothetical protein
MPSPSSLTRRPQATAFSIEDLLDRVRRGEVRVPEFQRPLRWQAKDVLALLDSVYRGYPIGTLLFWKREAPAASVSFGPVRINAPHHAQGLWVVDGQQRITALTGVLLHPPFAEGGPQDAFTVFFDLERQEFARVGQMPRPEPHWLPMNVVLDSELLLDWLDRYPGRASNPEHTRTAMRLGKAIREYQAPAYIVEADEERTLRVIFERLNSAGKPLRQSEVFNALYGGTSQAQPSDLRELAQHLEELGFGSIDQQWLLKAVLAVRGLNIHQDFRQHLSQDERDVAEALRQTERALRDTIIFIKRDVGIPHVALMPFMLPLAFLARFFHLHPEPSPRSRELLARWLWRGAINARHWGKNPADVQATLEAIDSDEEQTVQVLLADVQSGMPLIPEPDAPADLLASRTRVGLNALLALGPRDLRSGERLDIAALLNQQGSSWVQRVVTTVPEELLHSWSEELQGSLQEVLAGFSNRIIHPVVPGEGQLLTLLKGAAASPEVLRSHGIPPEASEALQRGDLLGFWSARADFLTQHVQAFIESRGRWQESDRPSLQSLIVPEED